MRNGEDGEGGKEGEMATAVGGREREEEGELWGLVHEGRMDAVTMATMAGFQGSASARWFG